MSESDEFGDLDDWEDIKGWIAGDELLESDSQTHRQPADVSVHQKGDYTVLSGDWSESAWIASKITFSVGDVN